MTTQPELFPNVASADKDLLRAHLFNFGWQTRRQICLATGWSERKVRDVAESFGSDIVRGQAGFKLTDQVNRDNPSDLARAMQAADSFASQGNRMLNYSAGLRRRLHAIIG